MIMSKWMKQLIEAKTPAPRDVVQDLVVERFRECWQREPYRSAVIPKGLLEAMAASVLDAISLAMAHAQKAPAEIEGLREDVRKYASDAEHWRERAQKAEAELKTTTVAGSVEAVVSGVGLRKLDLRKYARDVEHWRAREEKAEAEADLKMAAVACKPRFNVTQRFEGFSREQMPPPHDEARREFDGRACDAPKPDPRIPLHAGRDPVRMTAAPLQNGEQSGFDLTVQRGARFDSVRFEPDADLGTVIAGLHALLDRLKMDRPIEKPALICDGPARFSVDVNPVSRTLHLRVADEYGDSVSAGIRQGDSSLAGVQSVLMSLHEKIGARRKMLYG